MAVRAPFLSMKSETPCATSPASIRWAEVTWASASRSSWAVTTAVARTRESEVAIARVRASWARRAEVSSAASRRLTQGRTAMAAPPPM